MTQPLRIALVLAVVGACWMLNRQVVIAPAGAPDVPATIEVAKVRDQPLRFDPAVTAGEQQLVRQVIAGARPEAQRLIEAVDGLVVFKVGKARPGAVGLAESRGNADFTVTVDLDDVHANHGPRGIARTVLHEFGHVVDHALVDEQLMRTLDAGIPAGYACEPGERTGSCAEVPERFAESFAKWAMNDIGVDIYIGYKVPPPTMPLEQWGQPLAALVPAA
jgi:hypothetical protein